MCLPLRPSRRRPHSHQLPLLLLSPCLFFSSTSFLRSLPSNFSSTSAPSRPLPPRTPAHLFLPLHSREPTACRLSLALPRTRRHLSPYAPSLTLSHSLAFIFECEAVASSAIKINVALRRRCHRSSRDADSSAREEADLLLPLLLLLHPSRHRPPNASSEPHSR
jgi:hypothetical protein